MATIKQGNGNLTSSVLGSIRAYYMSMVCSAVPELCSLQTLLQYPTWITGGRDEHGNGRDFGHDKGVARTAVVVGMKEMEYQVVFEILAGLGVSALMVAVWLWMRALQRATGTPLKDRVRLRQRIDLGLCSLKSKIHYWLELLGDKVADMVHRFESSMSTTIGTRQKRSTESSNVDDPASL